jgi:hypothetical protein
MTWFSDIQRAEAVQIAETLTAAGRPELIATALREGWTLDDTRRQLAAETAPAGTLPHGTARSAHEAGIDCDRLEKAAAIRFGG